jgi:hypothetical protein
VWDYLTSSIVTAGSIGKLIVDNLNATITSRMATYTQPTGFLAATFPGTVASPTNITAASGVALTAAYDAAKTAAQAGDAMTLTAAYNAAKTAAQAGDAMTLTAAYDAAKTAAQAGDAMALTPTERNATCDAALIRDWTAVASPAARSTFNALRFLRNKWSIAGGILTVTKENDAATAWTGAVTTAPSDPVDSIDPA